MTSLIPSLEQERSKFAWACIESQKAGDDKLSDDYASEAKKLPVRIMTSGLGQALAFLHAKRLKKQGVEQLLVDLSHWVLVERQRPAPKGKFLPKRNTPDLLQSIVDGDSLHLRRATAETLAFLVWLNRFSEGAGLLQD